MCKHCKTESNTRRVKRKASDGSYQLFLQCVNCGENFDSKFLPKKFYPDWEQWTEVPPLDQALCSVCDKPGAQLNHYMPVSIARKAGVNPEAWPKGYLCKECHSLWHTLVTPGLLKENW